MIIWKGFGILIPIIPLGVFIGIQLIVEGLYGDGAYAEHSSKLLPAGFIVSTLITFFLYERWLKPKRDTSSFFFIPFRYWTFVFALLAAVSVVLLVFEGK